MPRNDGRGFRRSIKLCKLATRYGETNTRGGNNRSLKKDQNRLGDAFGRCSFLASIPRELGFFAVAFYGRPPARICSAQRHSIRH